MNELTIVVGIELEFWNFYDWFVVGWCQQVQLGRQVFLAGAHQAFDGDHRRLHNPPRTVARQETQSAQPQRHDIGHLNEQNKQ